MEATTTVAQVLPEDQIPDFEETLLANDEVLEELPDGALELAEALFSNECVENIRGGLRKIAMKFAKKNKPQTHCNPRQFPVSSSRRQKESCFRATPPEDVPDAPVPQSSALIARSRNQDPSSVKAKDRVMAILDTGASRCVMGEHLLQTFLSQLDVQTRDLVRVAPSAVKFRFGNSQTLTSQKKLLCMEGNSMQVAQFACDSDSHLCMQVHQSTALPDLGSDALRADDNSDSDAASQKASLDNDTNRNSKALETALSTRVKPSNQTYVALKPKPFASHSAFRAPRVEHGSQAKTRLHSGPEVRAPPARTRGHVVVPSPRNEPVGTGQTPSGLWKASIQGVRRGCVPGSCLDPLDGRSHGQFQQGDAQGFPPLCGEDGPGGRGRGGEPAVCRKPSGSSDEGSPEGKAQGQPRAHWSRTGAISGTFSRMPIATSVASRNSIAGCWFSKA